MKTFDPTTNRIPFALLTLEEQAELKAWPHGFECYIPEPKWGISTPEWAGLVPEWMSNSVYRGKPAPVVNSYWFSVYKGDNMGNMWGSKEAAITNSHSKSTLMRIDICKGEVTLTRETQ